MSLFSFLYENYCPLKNYTQTGQMFCYLLWKNNKFMFLFSRITCGHDIWLCNMIWYTTDRVLWNNFIKIVKKRYQNYFNNLTYYIIYVIVWLWRVFYYIQIIYTHCFTMLVIVVYLGIIIIILLLCIYSSPSTA